MSTASAAVLRALPDGWAKRLETAGDLAERRARDDRADHLATASPELDALLVGGLERGVLTEIHGGRSCGRFALALGALAETTGAGLAAALVDLGGSLEPRAAETAGVDPELLLWARTRDIRETLRAAEVILQAALPLVVIDLGTPPVRGGRGAEAAWRRLAGLAATQRVALLVSSPYRVTSTAAQVVVEARQRRAVWQGHGAAPRLLGGLDARLERVKHRKLHGAPRVEIGLRMDGAQLHPGTAAPPMPGIAPTNLVPFPHPARAAREALG